MEKLPNINDNFIASLDDYQMELFIDFVLDIKKYYKKTKKIISVLKEENKKLREQIYGNFK